MPTVYGAAADLLALGSEKGLVGDRNHPAGRLLSDLGYFADEAPDAASVPHRVALLRAADSLAALFSLAVRQAPGLVFLGGQVDPATLVPGHSGSSLGSVAGSGRTLREAFEGCVGEAVEYLSQFEAPGDVVASPGPGATTVAPFRNVSPRWPAGNEVRGWVGARRLHDGATVLLPAERCLRQAAAEAGAPPFAMSTGCGAGKTIEAAAMHAILELVERDAASLWWRGGQRGRPLVPDHAETAAHFLASLRQGRRERRSWLLDITSEIGVPCAAAISCNADGRGFACGTAARTTMAAAAQSALKEMCHIELALDLIAAKLATRADAKLNPIERRHWLRATAIDVDDCALLHPCGEPAAHRLPGGDRDFTSLVQHLDAAGVELHLVDLTRPRFGIPVVRVIAPDLQLEPCDLVSERLRRSMQETGGGDQYIRDIALF
jgi:ribosomal protein S12 methylthiotransferase accessory factor